MKTVLSLLVLVTMMVFSLTAEAGFEGLNQGSSLKIFSRVDCSAGISCSRVGSKFQISTTGSLHAMVAATATTITSAQCGSVFYNTGAVAIVLPAISASNLGCRLTFVTMNASNFDVDPSGSDQILALTDTGGDKIRNATAGNSVSLQAMATGKWAATAIYGTWADAN